MCSIVNAEALACLGGKEGGGLFSLDPLVSAGENAWLDGQSTLHQILHFAHSSFSPNQLNDHTFSSKARRML